MNYLAVKEETKRKFEELDFAQGDMFHEHYSFYYFIAAINGDDLVVFEGSPDHCPQVHFWTKTAFTEKCAYDSHIGYWVDYMKNEPRFIHTYMNRLIANRETSDRVLKLVKLLTHYEPEPEAVSA